MVSQRCIAAELMQRVRIGLVFLVYERNSYCCKAGCYNSKAEVYSVTESAQKAPDVRLDRVEEVKKKLQDPSYMSDEIIEETAKRILESFDL